MGKYIEQLKNLRMRGEGTPKTPNNQPEDMQSIFSEFLGAGTPPISKISFWKKRIESSNDLPEYFAIMQEFRNAQPSERDICEVYEVARAKHEQLQKLRPG